MRGVIVDDQMHFARGRGLAVDLVEEADELLMPVAAHALADDLAVEDVERGEQSGRAVPLIIMSRRAAAAALHRQPRLGAVEPWIWLFSSTDSTSACSAVHMPHTPVDFNQIDKKI